MAEDPQSVTDILDRMDDLAGRGDAVVLGDAVEALGNRSYGPFLIVPALLDIVPVGSIPGLPTVLAAIIILFSAQILLGRRHIWLPGFLARRSASARTVCKSTAKLRPLAARLDRWFHGRLPALTSGPFVRIAAAATILLALTVPPLELLPLATTAPMAAIIAFGLALLLRDGLLMIVALALAGAAVALGTGLLAARG